MFLVFLFKESFSSNQYWCLRETGPRESIAEGWMVSLKTVKFSSGSSERNSIASNRLEIALMKACLLLSCFSLETSSLFGTFLALWSSCRLNVQVQFADNKPMKQSLPGGCLSVWGVSRNHGIQIIIELVFDLICVGHCGCKGTYNSCMPLTR